MNFLEKIIDYGVMKEKVDGLLKESDRFRKTQITLPKLKTHKRKILSLGEEDHKMRASYGAFNKSRLPFHPNYLEELRENCENNIEDTKEEE